MTGLTLGNADTLLTERAADFLATGPADAQALISHVCQLPGAPAMVAEHMATALFAGHTRFTRDAIGRWMLRADHAFPRREITSGVVRREAWDRAIDQARAALSELSRAKADAVHHPRPEVFDHHVGLRGERLCDRQAFR